MAKKKTKTVELTYDLVKLEHLQEETLVSLSGLNDKYKNCFNHKKKAPLKRAMDHVGSIAYYLEELKQLKAQIAEARESNLKKVDDGETTD